MTKISLTTLLPLALAGCTVGPDYHRPDVPMPAHYSTTQPSAQTAPPADLSRWWETFQDPTLDSLVGRAVRSNLDLQVAQARLLESRAQRQIQTSGLFPVANGSASYNRDRFSKQGFYIPAGGAAALNNSSRARATTGGPGSGNGNNSTGLASAFNRTEIDTWQGGFDASWEIDIFGGVRRSIEAARADEAAAIDARRDALVSLLAEVARNYIDVRGLQRELAIARDNVKAQQDTVDLTRSRFQAGLATDLDVARAEAQVATTTSQIPPLQTSLAQAVHHIAVLLGQDPTSLESELSKDAPIPSAPPDVPI